MQDKCINKLSVELFRLYKEIVICDNLIHKKLGDKDFLKEYHNELLRECDDLQYDLASVLNHLEYSEQIMVWNTDPKSIPRNEFEEILYIIYSEAIEFVNHRWKSVV